MTPKFTSSIRTLLFVGGAWTVAAIGHAGDDIAQRRARVQQAAARGEAGIAELRAALDDDNPLVRRAAVRALAGVGAPARQALVVAQDVDDLVVQRAALVALAGSGAGDAVPYLAKGLKSSDPLVRHTAVQILAASQPRTDAMVALLRTAAKDDAPEIQQSALNALGAFYIAPPDTVLLRDRPEVADHVESIRVALEQTLPKQGWKFRADHDFNGHVVRWFDTDLDDSTWESIQIAGYWDASHVGVGWYRGDVELPQRPNHLAAELAFEGVAENAWVWLNGVYVGGHHVGPEGRNQPFRVDVTSALRWGQRNQITVRVMNTSGRGGIARPVKLEALELDR